MSAKATRSTGNTIHHSLLSDFAVIFSFWPGWGPGLCCVAGCTLELLVAMRNLSVESLTEGDVPFPWCVSVSAGLPLVVGLIFVTFEVVICLATMAGEVAFGFAAVATGA